MIGWFLLGAAAMMCLAGITSSKDMEGGYWLLGGIGAGVVGVFTLWGG